MKFFLRAEKWLFYLLIFFLFLQLRFVFYSFRPQFNEWASAYFYITDILIFALVFLWLARRIKEGFRSRFDWLERALFLFLLVSGLSIIVSNNLWLSFYSWIKLLELAALFLYVKNNFSLLFELKKFWQIFIAGAAFQAAIALVQFFKQGSLGLKIFAESPISPDIAGVAKIVVEGEKIIRAYGLVPHPNILATILVLAIFGLVYLFIKNYTNMCHSRENGNLGTVPAKGGNYIESRFRLKAGMTKGAIVLAVFVLVFILISFALFFTFSRSVIIIGLGLLVIWLVYLLRQSQFRKPALIAGLFFIFGFLFLVLIFWPYFSARYDIVALGQSQALNLRVFYSKMAWDIIKGSPIFGIGQGNFVWTISSLGLLENWVYQPVHNIYLLIAAETGILGLLAFLLFLFKVIRSVSQQKLEAAGDKLTVYCLLFTVCCLLTIGFFDHFLWDLQQGQLMFWLFLGVLASHTLSPRSSTG